MLIDDYLAYLSDVRRCSASTVRLRSSYLTRLAAEVDLVAATALQLQTWIAAHPQWTPRTVNAVVATLRSFYRWAVEAGVVSRDPSTWLRPVKLVDVDDARIASPEQIAAGLASGRLEVRVVTMLGAEGGLRVHEIAKLHERDRDGQWLSVLGKGGRLRRVRVSPELGAALDELRAKHPDAGWYFPSRGGHVSTQTVRNWTRRELGTNPHSLRHRAGTTVFKRTGNNLRVTQVFLGHASVATTAIYVHVEEDDLIEASAASRLAA
ncbi:tyrosine-type recombinase/integrase [Microbacterium sp. NEAU-LLC]|uniref:Tyrosine-type recombinase/integrase n=1 Tax=Microbacterium helvum TaxID=2773713 RepID=A0ABR8NNC4_9MICO|nr:tyrosine-type recombinase/integrase [Microbacterium helvum]MBD3941942.1 tyrosine-type recombinase/integrase [Microbacterium helvum]